MPRLLELLAEGISKPRKIPPFISRQVSEVLVHPTVTRNELGYKVSLKFRGADLSPDRPVVGDHNRNKALESAPEHEQATEEVRELGLHSHLFPPKNWDALKSLKTILEETDEERAVLDAGGSEHSPLVEWLFLYGYDELYVDNIDFDHEFSRGPIMYRKGDLTDTEYPAEIFDAIAILSVIEHGVNIRTMLDEFYRLLAPGGVVTVSTDFWPKKIRTEGTITEYGESIQKWTIFSAEEIDEILAIAAEVGFNTPAEIEYTVTERPIDMKGKSYTFVYFELRKPD